MTDKALLTLDDIWELRRYAHDHETLCYAVQRTVLSRQAEQSASATSVQPGWKLVPDTATHNMLIAANAGRKKGRSSSGDIYAAMLASAPTQASATSVQPVAWRMVGPHGKVFYEDVDPREQYTQGWLDSCHSVTPLYAAPGLTQPQAESEGGEP